MPRAFSARAERRARLLLASLLTEAELARLMADDYLDVRSPTVPGRIYRVPAHIGQVTVYQDGRPVMRLCVVPTRALPDDDVIAMHKLMIEGDEHEYLRRANRFPVFDEEVLRLSQRQLRALFPFPQ